VLRDVGKKALGLTEDPIKMLSSQVWGWSEEGVEAKHAEENEQVELEQEAARPHSFISAVPVGNHTRTYR
jgi:hypothetical protein